MPQFHAQSGVDICEGESSTPKIALGSPGVPPEPEPKISLIRESGRFGIQSRFMPLYFLTAPRKMTPIAEKDKKSVDKWEQI